MNRVVLINCYFGKFPNYFDLWIESALKNPDFDFLIFTDNVINKKYDNIKFINIKFEELKEIFQNVFEFKICLPNAYKLCDYKAVFGLALQDYIKDYEFWGYVDIDLILGNLSNYITKEVLNNSDKINKYGHFQIYRNNMRMNTLFRIDNHSTLYNYKRVFKIKLCCHFDEDHGVSTIAENESDIRAQNINEYFDVDYTKFAFKNVNGENRNSIFKYENGKLIELFIDENNKISEKEVMYVHLQKRSMEMEISNTYTSFYIVPNKFIDEITLDTKKIKEYTMDCEYSEWKLKKRNILINKIKNNAIQEKVYRILKKIYIKIKYKRNIKMK
ncbi:MAG: hypothetical protein IJW20_01480 [Clostridia bacterium]|nr:hypothetical protein [Clostridia bacterium]